MTREGFVKYIDTLSADEMIDLMPKIVRTIYKYDNTFIDHKLRYATTTDRTTVKYYGLVHFIKKDKKQPFKQMLLRLYDNNHLQQFSSTK